MLYHFLTNLCRTIVVFCHNAHMKTATAILFTTALWLVGGGGSASSKSGCFTTAIKVSPGTAIIDHTASAPGNSLQFDAFTTAATSGCNFSLANLQNATWSISDPVNANISNSHDQFNANYGRATCINAAPVPITVTATVPSGDGSSNVSSTATLTCN
jgi:hypothetical protein